MRARFDTLFGRLFGVLLLAIILAHLLAFAWFHHYGPPRLHRRRDFPKAWADSARRWTRALKTGHRGLGSAAPWCR